MTEATVEQLQRELTAQAAAAHAALAAEQEASARAQAELVTARSELVALHEELRRCRTELRWLRRAGVELNAVVERPVMRALRSAAAFRRAPGR